MENLKTKIKNFNQSFQKESNEYYRLKILDDDLPELKKILDVNFANVFPVALEKFYCQFGGIKTDFYSPESFSINIPSLKTLMASLNQEGKYYKLVSIGIIDQIMFSWGNDRWEFDDEISVENRHFLNENYKCFGWYRYDSGLEAANYLYFDKKGKFGEILYNQYYFEELRDDILRPMLSESPATEDLEDMLSRIIDKLESGIDEREEIENDD